MSAFEELKEKKVKTNLDHAVLFFGDEQIATCDEEVAEAESAAAELAALEAVAEAANQLVFHGDSRKAQWETLAATLAELEATK